MAKILIVDDDPELLQIARLALSERGGHETVLCADGSEGLARALADPPDVAILDVMMPDVTGYDICRKLRANPATASMPIIILTARAQPVDRQAAAEAGADDCVFKPVSMSEVLERVNGLLSGHPSTSRARPSGCVVMMSLRGGVGTTTLSVNLAAGIAGSGDGSVCLVDLCPSSGHVALQLGMRPKPNWSALTKLATFGKQDFDALLLRHSSGLKVLASPVFPVRGRGLTAGALRRIVAFLDGSYQAAIFDAPPVLDESISVLLDAATAVVLVLTAEAPSLQTAVGTLHALSPWSGKLHIVSNQVASGASIPASAVEATLKHPVVCAVPFDPAQARALAEGVPLVLSSPRSLLGSAVMALVDSLAKVAGADVSVEAESSLSGIGK
jgi:pilus assembly protein CpaE